MSMELDEILHQIQTLSKKVRKLSREIESARTVCLKDPYSLQNLLKTRGLRIFRKDPRVRLLFPPELSLLQKSRFFETMKKYSFRLVLRDMIKHQSRFRVQDGSMRSGEITYCLTMMECGWRVEGGPSQRD
jgi:hypothetical protein